MFCLVYMFNTQYGQSQFETLFFLFRVNRTSTRIWSFRAKHYYFSENKRCLNFEYKPVSLSYLMIVLDGGKKFLKWVSDWIYFEYEQDHENAQTRKCHFKVYRREHLFSIKNETFWKREIYLKNCFTCRKAFVWQFSCLKYYWDY